eukprot:4204667-Pyramimonas_sp.AAC.1
MPLGASWGHLGPLEVIFGVLDRSWTVWDHIELSGGRFGALLERSWGRLRGPWAVLDASWAVLGPAWAILGPSWRLLWPSWGGIGVLLGRLRASEDPEGE